MQSIPSDIRAVDVTDSRSSKAERVDSLVLARCAVDPSRPYMAHRHALYAEIRDRDQPLPRVLDTDALRNERVLRDVAISGRPYLECYAAVMHEQREVRLRKSEEPKGAGRVLPFPDERKAIDQLIDRVRAVVSRGGTVVSRVGMVKRTGALPAVDLRGETQLSPQLASELRSLIGRASRFRSGATKDVQRDAHRAMLQLHNVTIAGPWSAAFENSRHELIRALAEAATNGSSTERLRAIAEASAQLTMLLEQITDGSNSPEAA